jgi:hypothetical protein
MECSKKWSISHTAPIVPLDMPPSIPRRVLPNLGQHIVEEMQLQGKTGIVPCRRSFNGRGTDTWSDSKDYFKTLRLV